MLGWRWWRWRAAAALHQSSSSAAVTRKQHGLFFDFCDPSLQNSNHQPKGRPVQLLQYCPRLANNVLHHGKRCIHAKCFRYWIFRIFHIYFFRSTMVFQVVSKNVVPRLTLRCFWGTMALWNFTYTFTRTCTGTGLRSEWFG